MFVSLLLSAVPLFGQGCDCSRAETMPSQALLEAACCNRVDQECPGGEACECEASNAELEWLAVPVRTPSHDVGSALLPSNGAASATFPVSEPWPKYLAGRDPPGRLKPRERLAWFQRLLI